MQSRAVRSRKTPPSLLPSILPGEKLSCTPSLLFIRHLQLTLLASFRSHIDLPISWPSTANTSTISPLTTYLTSHTLSLGRIASSLGSPEASYSSESDYHEKDWQAVWYGEENYRGLLEAKSEWDPEGVFSARRAVGSEVVGW